MRFRRVAGVGVVLSLAASVLVGVGGSVNSKVAAQVVLPTTAALPNGQLARQVGATPPKPVVTRNVAGSPKTVLSVSDGSVPFVGAVRTGAPAAVAAVSGGHVGGELSAGTVSTGVAPVSGLPNGGVVPGRTVGVKLGVPALPQTPDVSDDGSDTVAGAKVLSRSASVEVLAGAGTSRKLISRAVPGRVVDSTKKLVKGPVEFRTEGNRFVAGEGDALISVAGSSSVAGNDPEGLVSVGRKGRGVHFTLRGLQSGKPSKLTDVEDPDAEDDAANAGTGSGGTSTTTISTIPGDPDAPDLAATVTENPDADDAAAAAAVGGTVTTGTGSGSGGKDKNGKDKKDKKEKDKKKAQQGEKAVRSARVPGQAAGKKRVVLSNVVAGGGSLEYSVDATGVKEKVRLNDVPDGTGDVVYRFPFVADGLIPKLVGNRIDFVDGRGVVAWSMPRGVAWDSKGGASTPANQFVDVAYALETRKGRGFELVVTVPGAWLRDPARVFPVFVDPSISYGVGSGAIVSAGQPTQWIGTNATTGVGNALQFGSFFSSTWEAYARFDTAALNGGSVQNATLTMSLVNCGKTGVDQSDPVGNYVDPILIGALTSAYDPSTVTYSIKPGVGAQLSFPTGTGYGPRPVSFNITSLVNGWAASPGSNFGLSFQMGSTDEYCVLDLGASSLAVDYTPAVAVNTAPTVTAIAPVAGAAVVGVPTFIAAPVDAEGDPVSLFFQMCTGADAETGTCVTSGWLGTGITSWIPPAGALVSGGTYYWKVLASSTGFVSAWTAVRSFSMVNLPATIVPVGPPSGAQLPGSPTFDVSVTDPENDPFNVYFRVCTGTDGESGNCVSSDWLAPGVVSWAPPGGLLTRGTTYYWHAKAASNGVETPWTPVWSFTFIDRAPVIGLVTPLTGVASDAIPELITTASDPDGDATLVEYRVCLSTDAETDCVVSPTTGTTWQVPADELAVNTQYFWKARAFANGVYSPWSEIRSFVTSIPNTDPTALAYGYSPYLTVDSGGDSGGGVNGATGVFVRTDKDAQIPSIGKLLGVARTYNSGDGGADVAGVRAFGYAWSSVLDMKLVEQADGVIIRYPDGRREWHGRNPNGTYASQQGFYSTLTKPNTSRLATWRLTLKDFTTFTFDRNGRLSQITDEAGHPVDFTMTNGRIVSMIDRASGRSLTFTYNGAAHVTRVDETPLTYGGAANPVTKSWSYTYVGNKLTKVCDPRGAAFCRRYEYTPTGAKLSRVLKPNGNVDVAVTYVPDDVRVQTRTDGVGNVTSYIYYPVANGQKSVRTTDARGNSTVDFYDATFNRLVQRIDKDSKIYVTSYNAYGFVSSTGGGEVTSFVTDERGNVTASTDERGNTTTNTFWPASITDRRSDKLKTVTSPLGKVSSFDYDPATGRPTVTTNASGSTVTTYTTGSDPAQGGGVVPIGLPKTVTSRGGRTTTYTYNRAGDAVLTVNAAGLRTQVGYDEHGKAVSETQLSDTYPAGVTTQTVYNAVGQIIQITGPRVRNRVTGVDHQARTVNTYNANGDLTEELTTDIAGGDQQRRTRHSFDANDQRLHYHQLWHHASKRRDVYGN